MPTAQSPSRSAGHDGGRNCTPGPEIPTVVRQWRLIRGVSNSLDQYTGHEI